MALATERDSLVVLPDLSQGWLQQNESFWTHSNIHSKTCETMQAVLKQRFGAKSIRQLAESVDWLEEMFSSLRTAHISRSNLYANYCAAACWLFRTVQDSRNNRLDSARTVTARLHEGLTQFAMDASTFLAAFDSVCAGYELDRFPGISWDRPALLILSGKQKLDYSQYSELVPTQSDTHRFFVTEITLDWALLASASYDEETRKQLLLTILDRLALYHVNTTGYKHWYAVPSLNWAMSTFHSHELASQRANLAETPRLTHSRPPGGSIRSAYVLLLYALGFAHRMPVELIELMTHFTIHAELWRNSAVVPTRSE